jgi:hypothetical protein
MYSIHTETFSQALQETSKGIGKSVETLLAFQSSAFHFVHELLVLSLEFGCEFRVFLAFVLLSVSQIEGSFIFEFAHGLVKFLSGVHLFFFLHLNNKLSIMTSLPFYPWELHLKAIFISTPRK